MELKDKLREDRRNKGMTQEEYAKALNITRGTLSHLEKGRTPSADTMKKISQYFNIPISKLLGNEKVQKMSELETTNMIIDNYIESGEIREDYISREARETIKNTLKLEIKLKLEMKKKRN